MAALENGPQVTPLPRGDPPERACASKPKFSRPVLGTPLGWRDWPISSWRGGPRLSAPPCFCTKLRKDEAPGAALHHEKAGRRIPHLPGVTALIRTPRPSARCCSGTARTTLQSFGSSPKARAGVGAAVGVSRSRWSSCTGAVSLFLQPDTLPGRPIAARSLAAQIGWARVRRARPSLFGSLQCQPACFSWI